LRVSVGGMPKVQVSFRIEEDVVKRMRNAVHHNRGAPEFLTLDGFVEAQLDAGVRKLEKKNGGEFDEPRRKAHAPSR
jgi:hypothetical protein